MLALASALFVLMFAWGEPAASRALTGQEVVLLALMVFALAGNVAAWRWEAVGAVVALTSTLAFTGIELARRGPLPGPWLLGVMAAPAICYAASWLLRQRAAT